MDQITTSAGTATVGGSRSSGLPTATRKVCGDCKGLGEIFGYSNVEDGPMDVNVWPCAECDATGYVTVEGRAA